VQLATLEGGSKSSDELATKYAPQYSNGKEEAWVRSNPASVIAGESAGGNDTVDMRVKLEFLIPGMEHAEEADLGSEMSGIASHFEQCLGTGLEQEMVQDLFVVQGERRQLVG
jgi:hypothetical protein